MKELMITSDNITFKITCFSDLSEIVLMRYGYNGELRHRGRSRKIYTTKTNKRYFLHDRTRVYINHTKESTQVRLDK